MEQSKEEKAKAEQKEIDRKRAARAYCRTCSWDGRIHEDCKWFCTCQELANFLKGYDEE